VPSDCRAVPLVERATRRVAPRHALRRRPGVGIQTVVRRRACAHDRCHRARVGLRADRDPASLPRTPVWPCCAEGSTRCDRVLHDRLPNRSGLRDSLFGGFGLRPRLRRISRRSGEGRRGLRCRDRLRGRGKRGNCRRGRCRRGRCRLCGWRLWSCRRWRCRLCSCGRSSCPTRLRRRLDRRRLDTRRLRSGRRRRLRRHPGRQQAERIDVAVRVARHAHAEKDVRHERDGVRALADGADNGTLRDEGSAHDARGPELEQRDRVRAGLDRDYPPPARDRADERDGAAGRRAHVLAHGGADVDAAMLAAGVRVRAEGEGPEDRPVDRPRPGARGRSEGEHGHDDRGCDEQATCGSPRSGCSYRHHADLPSSSGGHLSRPR
jgi:hypothetical protein